MSNHVENEPIPEESASVETLPQDEMPMAEPMLEETTAPEMSVTPHRTPMDDTAISAPAAQTPRLVVIRGLHINMEYPLYEGDNFIGRTDEKPVDIDLENQESPERIWCSRQHAKVTVENGQIVIEDLGSQNGTFVNRSRTYPGQPQTLSNNDVIQIGTVQLRVKLGE